MTIFTLRKAALVAMLSIVLAAAGPHPAAASDHADPAVLRDPDANITDLFFFPDGDRYVVILDVHRALTSMGPYELAKYEFRVNFDLHTGVGFDDASQTARYGGSIAHPEGIKEDVWLAVRLKNDASRAMFDAHGFSNAGSIMAYTGVRDDPFIFPRFFKKNTIAMVFSIPRSSFPASAIQEQRTFVIWGAAYKDGRQVDHVGRSNRTQQFRFDGLNTLPPSQHVAAIMKRDSGVVSRLYSMLGRYRETMPLAAGVQLLALNRSYDRVPDVMVYSPKRPTGFPNGRWLTDDVAAQTCAAGDCILQELSFVEGGWPRRTTNDKTFSPQFPYLAEPWKEGDTGFKATPAPLPSIVPRLVAIAVILLAIFIVMLWFMVKGIVAYAKERRERRESTV